MSELVQWVMSERRIAAPGALGAARAMGALCRRRKPAVAGCYRRRAVLVAASPTSSRLTATMAIATESLLPPRPRIGSARDQGRRHHLARIHGRDQLRLAAWPLDEAIGLAVGTVSG